MNDLRRKSFIATKHISQNDVLSSRFLTHAAADFSKTKSFLRSLCAANNLPFD